MRWLTVFVLFCSLFAIGQSTTPNLQMSWPAHGAKNWDNQVVANSLILDNIFGIPNCAFMGWDASAKQLVCGRINDDGAGNLTWTGTLALNPLVGLIRLDGATGEADFNSIGLGGTGNCGTSTGICYMVGSGAPEGVVTAHVGSLYVDILTGAYYSKTTGVAATGWTSISTGISASSTYYVDNGGSNSNSGLTPALAWQTISKVNGVTFNPGDSVLFNRGDTWREEVIVPSSGTLGFPITFGAYGNGSPPRITAANVQSSWTLDAGSVYYYSSGTDPGTVSRNGVLLVKMASKAAVVNSTQWFYDSGASRVYIFGNPSGATMEVGVRASAIVYGNKSYITVQDLWLESGTVTVVDVSSGASFPTVRRNLIKNGIGGISTSNTVGDNGTITDNTITDIYGHGLVIGNGNYSNWYVARNEISYAGYANPSGGTNCSGMYIFTGTGTNDLFEFNNVHHNGLGPGSATNVVCHGIYNDGGANTIRYNSVHDNAGAGIQTHADNSIIFSNLLYGNAVGALAENGATGVQVIGNLFYNNYNPTQNNEAGLYVQGNSTTISVLKNNLFLANCYKFTTSINCNQSIYVQTGSPNPSITTADGNLYWGTVTGGENLFNYQGSTVAFAAWQGLGFDTNGLNADPLLRSPATYDFRPTGTSPVINAGLNLGGAYQFGLNNVSASSILSSDQDSYGSAWEIGPYIYNPQNDISTSSYLATPNGATNNCTSNSELITLSTSGATTDSTNLLLPANSLIQAVVARITTTITTATDWKLGDASTAGRFSAANATLTAGTTQVGTVQATTGIASATTGMFQSAAAKLRITTTGTPGAGIIRVTVFSCSIVPPQN